MKKKIQIISVCCIIGLLAIFFVLPTNVKTVSDALANSENGDIAFVYDAQKMSFTLAVLTLCDKNGNVLFEESFYDGGKVDFRLAFYGENIYAYSCVSKKLYGFDRSGNPLADFELRSSDVKNRMPFDGWSSGIIESTYVLGEYTYRYERPFFFKKSSKLVIEHSGEATALFEG